MLLRESLTDDELLKKIFRQLKEYNGKMLKLGGEKITSLPEGIGNLTNLVELVLVHNQLTSLPDSIGNLTNLKELHLNNNQLTSLPESIGKLTNLEKLVLHNNKLKTLPNSIGNLKKLERLDLVGNPISDEEVERIKKLFPNTEIYFFDYKQG